ncbi:MAG: hypothetical protein WAU68_17290 [Vitreimonas sp.]
MRGRVKRACAAIAALAILAGLPAAAQVPPQFQRELSQRLAEAGRAVSEGGYLKAAGPFAGGLSPQQSRRYPLTLRAGQDYRVIAVCDSRCGDIDLRLYDVNGTQVAQDVLNDNVPTLAIRPSATGPHTIEIDMYQCTAAPDPCWYALNVYTR